MKLMYITNETKIAQIAEESGVDRIFIDLEIKGKEQRQGHLDTVISRHTIQDVGKIKNVLKKAELLVRINPVDADSEDEIERVLEQKADVIMLPYFKTVEEVKKFISLVNGRAKTCLLLETKVAYENVDKILELDGIDEIHIGLNDLHLDYKMKFMFEPLANGMVEKLCEKFKAKNITYGFGGVARVGSGDLPAEHILIEHLRLGSSMVILSRSFCNTKVITDIEQIRQIFSSGVKDIRDVLKNNYTQEQYLQNKQDVSIEINNIVEKIKKI